MDQSRIASSKFMKLKQLLRSERLRVHAAMTLVELSFAGGQVLGKAALTVGTNPYVFAVYRDAVAVFVLVSMAIITERGKRPRCLKAFLIMSVASASIGIFGFQVLYLTGLSMSSANLASALMGSILAFTVVIAAIFRTEEFQCGSIHGKAKVVGVLFCMAGALLMVLYKGPVVISLGNATSYPSIVGVHNTELPQRQLWSSGSITGSTFSHKLLAPWQVGSILILGSCICAAAFVNLQGPLLSRYTAPVSVTAFCYIFGATMITVFSMFKVEDSSLWALKSSTEIIAVLYAGVITSATVSSLQSWCAHKGGPILVSSYSPLQIIFTSILGMVFLNEALHLASVIGTLTVFVGLYLIIWDSLMHQNLINSKV
eukprot:Gb_37004 [translate_table: standard]